MGRADWFSKEVACRVLSSELTAIELLSTGSESLKVVYLIPRSSHKILALKCIFCHNNIDDFSFYFALVGVILDKTAYICLLS